MPPGSSARMSSDELTRDRPRDGRPRASAGSSRQRLADVRDRIPVVDGDLADGRRRRAPDRATCGPRRSSTWPGTPNRDATCGDVGRNLASLVQRRSGARRGGRDRVSAGRRLAGPVSRTRRPGRSIYEAAKAAAHGSPTGSRAPGMSVACGHVFYLFGPGEDERRVIPSVIRALLDGRADRDDGRRATCATTCTSPTSRPRSARWPNASVTGGVDICSGSPVKLRRRASR